MTSNNWDLCLTAIRQRLQIHATYLGFPRQFCPHVLGLIDRQPRCLMYQFGGQSNARIPIGPPGAEENWRLLNVAELGDPRLVEGPWYSARNYDGGAKMRFDPIVEAVG
jgi:hypothetical protein